MVSSDIVIVGTGGSGREHLCVINDINDLTPGTWNLVGFLASEPPPAGLIEVIGSQYLGSGKTRTSCATWLVRASSSVSATPLSAAE